jgi:hypothetical protein
VDVLVATTVPESAPQQYSGIFLLMAGKHWIEMLRALTRVYGNTANSWARPAPAAGIGQRRRLLNLYLGGVTFLSVKTGLARGIMAKWNYSLEGEY